MLLREKEPTTKVLNRDSNDSRFVIWCKANVHIIAGVLTQGAASSAAGLSGRVALWREQHYTVLLTPALTSSSYHPASTNRQLHTVFLNPV